jgi:hypothetical protein
MLTAATEGCPASGHFRFRRGEKVHHVPTIEIDPRNSLSFGLAVGRIVRLPESHFDSCKIGLLVRGYSLAI